MRFLLLNLLCLVWGLVLGCCSGCGRLGPAWLLCPLQIRIQIRICVRVGVLVRAMGACGAFTASVLAACVSASGGVCVGAPVLVAPVLRALARRFLALHCVGASLLRAGPGPARLSLARVGSAFCCRPSGALGVVLLCLEFVKFLGFTWPVVEGLVDFGELVEEFGCGASVVLPPGCFVLVRRHPVFGCGAEEMQFLFRRP